MKLVKMRCIVRRPGCPPKSVTNLGWLNRHVSEVTKATVIGLEFIAELRCGTEYRCAFADRKVLEEWLARKAQRSLRHAQIIVTPLSVT